MKFFFPDSQDLVDPSFDFTTERRSLNRLRHRDDLYAHEVFAGPAYDGMLVSKGIVDGMGGGAGGKYSLAQRHRLLRLGSAEFFRLSDSSLGLLPIMGDCGAFTYVREKVPPFSVDEVLQFYGDCGFNLGISVDHVILEYQPRWDDDGSSQASRNARERQKLTLELAAEFLTKCRTRHKSLQPVGVAQGWSPRSYATAVSSLERMGYDYVAMGGMVPLKTREILATLAAVADVKRPGTRLHLLGVARTEHLENFADYGVVSFDSTSPLRQAFKDEKNNYYSPERTYTAVRVPQVEGNPALQRRIRSGEVKQPHARALEQRCLGLLREYDNEIVSLEQVLDALDAYQEIHSPGRSYRDSNAETLRDRPWRHCPCDVCSSIGWNVILFRGAERNRRRGFHNLWVFYRSLADGSRTLDAEVQASLAF